MVDNDPEKSARAVVEQWSTRADRVVRVRYVCEPDPGISAARNRAVDESEDQSILAFIDDGERPIDGWLDALLATCLAEGATGVVGPIEFRFAHKPESWIITGACFERRRLPTGSLVDVAATNNLLLDLDFV